jgi:RNA polymerase sigma factor (sigma-70 family)
MVTPKLPDDIFKRYVDNPLFADTIAATKALFPMNEPLPPLPAPSQVTMGGQGVRSHKPELLTPEQQAQAFLKYNFAKKRYAQTGQLKWRARAAHYREYLARCNIGLIPYAIKRWHFTDEDESISSGFAALLRAIQTYDVSRNVAFSTYAVVAIQREVGRQRFRADKKFRRFTRFTDLITGDTDRVLQFSGVSPPPETELESQEMHERLQRAIEALRPDMRDIIQGRFLDEKKLTRRDISRGQGCSKERIRQNETEALDLLRIALGVRPRNSTCRPIYARRKRQRSALCLKYRSEMRQPQAVNRLEPLENVA